MFSFFYGILKEISPYIRKRVIDVLNGTRRQNIAIKQPRKIYIKLTCFNAVQRLRKYVGGIYVSSVVTEFCGANCKLQSAVVTQV